MPLLFEVTRFTPWNSGKRFPLFLHEDVEADRRTSAKELYVERNLFGGEYECTSVGSSGSLYMERRSSFGAGHEFSRRHGDCDRYLRGGGSGRHYYGERSG